MPHNWKQVLQWYKSNRHSLCFAFSSNEHGQYSRCFLCWTQNQQPKLIQNSTIRFVSIYLHKKRLETRLTLKVQYSFIQYIGKLWAQYFPSIYSIKYYLEDSLDHNAWAHYTAWHDNVLSIWIKTVLVLLPSWPFKNWMEL